MPYKIYSDFWSILVPKDNGKAKSRWALQIKHVASGYGYKLVNVDDSFSKSCLGKDLVYNFIKSMVEEIKYCSGAMKKHFNKKLVMTKEDHEDFENCTKCWICDSAYVDGDVKG